jgi:diguanylate cyclase (GGDEF)-like protein
MDDINDILDRLKENDEIARKFSDIEIKILTILNFTDLFEVLLTEIMTKFQVPHVWISMIDKSEVSNLIQALDSSDLLKKRMNIIERDIFLELIGNSTKPILLNQDLKPYFKLFPQGNKYFIRSLAITPLTLDGEIIGSLNQGDFSNKRFQEGMDTSLLGQLAIKTSICLSNVTAHEKLKFMAFHDPLTGLLNRRVMESVLRREYNRAKRYNSVLSVAFLDVDGFKGVNDTYGHDTGDDMLKYIAHSMMKMSRESDIVSRYAGDEFVIILPETGSANAKHLLERLEALFEEKPLVAGNQSIPVKISFGVSSTEDEDLLIPEDLIKKADELLYQAKTLRKSNANSPSLTNENKIIRLPSNE